MSTRQASGAVIAMRCATIPVGSRSTPPLLIDPSHTSTANGRVHVATCRYLLRFVVPRIQSSKATSAFLSFAIGLVAAGFPTATLAQRWQDFIPLHVGSTWVYTDEQWKARVTVRVAARASVANDSCWRVTWTLDSHPQEPYRREIWCQRAEGLRLGAIFLEGKPLPISDASWILKSPIRAGEKWSSEHPETKLGNLRGSVIGNETVETPAGSFNTVHVRIEIADTTIDRWFARNIGMVQEEAHFGGYQLTRLQLEKVPPRHQPITIKVGEKPPPPKPKPPTPTVIDCTPRLIAVSGADIPTNGWYEVVGASVHFRDPNGKLLSVRLNRVDLGASESLREQCAAQ